MRVSGEEAADWPQDIFFVKDQARPTIWASGILAFCLIASGFVLADPVLMLTSLMPMAVSAYHLPMARNDRPQVILSQAGIFIDGLGLIPWVDIQSAELWDPLSVEGATGSGSAIVGTELIIETRHHIEFTIDPQQDLTLARTFQVMVWRLEELNIVRVRMDPLDIDPVDFAGEVRRRLRRSRNWVS